jgi:polyhydroxyalkanoate synthase
MIDLKNIQQESETIAKCFEDAKNQIKNHDHSLHQCERVLLNENAISTLYRYKNSNDLQSESVLIVYSWVNNATILDFSENSSLIQSLIQLGVTVYLLDWKLPQPDSATLSDYLYQQIADSVRHIQQLDELKPHLMGVCQGGNFALSYAGVTWAKDIASLSLLMTPIDANPSLSLLNQYGAAKLPASVISNVIPGELIQTFFNMLSPMKQIYGRPFAAVMSHSTEHFLKVDGWLNQTAHLSAPLVAEYNQIFFQENTLMQEKPEIAGMTINVDRIDVPILNCMARYDRLVVPDSSKALSSLVCEKYYRELYVAGGHLAIFTEVKAQSDFITHFQKYALNGKPV